MQEQPRAADIITTFADLHDRIVRVLQECGLALAIVLNERDRLDDRAVEALTTASALLDRAVRDVHATAFAVRGQLRPRSPVSAQRRYVVRIEDEAVIAYCDGDGHDFRRVHDDSVWAHESEGTLLSARSGTPIARRSGIVYYDPVTDLPLYYETS